MSDLDIIKQLEQILGITFETGKAELLYFQSKGKYGYYATDKDGNVTKIILYKIRIAELHAKFFELKNCKSFTALHCEIESVPSTIGNMSSLQFLNLGFNNLSQLPDSIAECRDLHSIILLNNSFEKIPESVLKLPELKLLSFESNKIVEYPEVLNRVKTGMRINLMRNLITELPYSVLNSKLKLRRFLSNREGIFLAGNKLVNPPLALLKFSRGSLPLYFKLKEENVRLSALHIVLLQFVGFFLRFGKRN